MSSTAEFQNWFRKARPNGKFQNWFNRRPVSETAQERAAWFDEFVELANDSGIFFRLSEDGTSLESSARCLVGVALWSRYDMLLLDDVATYVSDSKSENLPADTQIRFEVADFGGENMSEEILNRFIPDRPPEPIYHTPVVAMWENGERIWYGSGHLARNFIVNLLNSNTEQF